MLKRILSVIIIVSLSMQLGICVSAASGDAKDPYNWIYLNQHDGEDYYLPINFGYRNGLGMDTQTGHFVSWENVMFTETPVSVELVYGTAHAGTKFELRLDSTNGQVVASFAPEPTGNMYVKANMEVNVSSEVTGVHTLYAVWKTGYLNIECLKFKRYGEDTVGYSLFEGISEDTVYQDIAGNDLEYEIKLLNQLGMLGFTEDNKFDSKKVVTRGELVQSLCGFYTDDVDAEGMYFLDLPVGHSKSEYANFMYKMGIVEMENDGYFRPEVNVTVREAMENIKKIFNLPQMNNNFANQAEKSLENSLLSGVSAKLDAELTRQNLAKMLVNAIEAPYMTYRYGGDSVGLAYTDGILLETRSINRTYGLVTAIPSTSLSSVESGISQGEVMIDDVLYKDSKGLAQKYLGYECVIFYEEENDELDIKVIYPRSNVSEEVIDTTKDHELITFTEQMTEYYDEEENQKKIRFNKTAYFIYNGKAIDDTIDRFVNIDTFQGKIRIIKNRNCTVAVIDEYQNVLMKAIDDTNSKYLDKITDTVIDLSGDNVTIYRNSLPIMAGDVPAESIAYIYKSKNTIGDKITRVVILPDNEISGVITAIKDGRITIDEKEYKTVKEYTPEFTLGMYVTLKLNSYDEIIWSKTNASEEMQLGIYLGYTLSDEEDRVIVKLFTKEQKIEKFECSEKLLLDGVSRKEVEYVTNGKGDYKGLADVEKRTPVMYMINEENKVNVIDTYYIGRENRYDMLVKVGPNQKYRWVSGPRMFVEQTNGYGALPMEQNSTLISLWKDSDDTYNQIEVLQNQIHSVQFPVGQGYSTKGNEKLANIFLWQERETYGGYEHMLVEKVTEILDENDEVRTVIKGYIGAQAVERRISTQSAIDTAAINNVLDNLECGDFIRIYNDAIKDISKIEVQYFCDGVPSRNGITAVLNTGDKPVYRIGEGGYVLNEIRTLCKVTNIEENFIFVKVGTGSTAIEEAYALTSPGVMKVTSKGIEAGLTTREVFNSETNGHNALMYVTNGAASQIVIYE